MPGRIEKTITLLECYVEQQERKGIKMNKPKIFLTSIVAIMLVAPSFATVGETNFETNQTGVSSCEIGVLGVDENAANANAQWSANTYSCGAGSYLPNGTNWTGLDDGCAACPAGSYCGGGTYTYSESGNQGLNSCPSGFTSSDMYSLRSSDCYRTCTLADVAHATSVKGRFYSDNANVCEPTDSNSCAAGYHYVAGTQLTEQSITFDTTYRFGVGKKADGAYCVSEAGCEDDSVSVPDWSGTWTEDFGPSWETYKTNNQTMIQSLASDEWFIYVYKNFEQKELYGTMRGIATCSNVASNTGNEGEMKPANAIQPGGTGRYCWLMPTTWTPDGGTRQPMSQAWIYMRDYYQIGVDPAENCAKHCMGYAVTATRFQQPLFPTDASVLGLMNASPAQCVANTITLNWKNAIGGTHATTQCTYGGTIDTPTTAPTKRGHTFTGWRFVAPSGN